MKWMVSMAACILLAGCAKEQPVPPQVEAAKPEAQAQRSPEAVTLDANQQKQANLVIEAASTRAMPRHVQTTGRLTVNENKSWHVGAVTDGKIIRVVVNPGDRVQKDQVLAGMHSHQIHEGRAEYRKATSELARLKTAVTYAQRHRDRAKRLYDLKAGSLEQVEHADAELSNAQGAVINAEAELERTRKHLTEFLQVSLDDHDEHKDGDTDHDGDLIPVKAPASGIVLTRHVTSGSVASAGQELFTIADLSTVWMIAAVSEEHLGKIRLGMTAKVTVQAYPDQTFLGRITKLGEQLDPQTRTIPVRIELANAGGKLKPEMYATVEIAAGASGQGIFIPQSAIQQVEGKNVVFVRQSAERFEPRPVQTGLTMDGHIEITLGLKPGEQIVTSGSFTLKSHLMKGSLAE
jgi:membrane fusion protein, heavy metal efflux system